MSISQTLVNLLLFPFRLLWNIFVIVGTISLEIMWIGFVFGSVIGVILLLIFWLEGFVFPLVLFAFMTRLWPEEELAELDFVSTEERKASNFQDSDSSEKRAGGFRVGDIGPLKRIALGTLVGIALIAFLILIKALVSC